MRTKKATLLLTLSLTALALPAAAQERAVDVDPRGYLYGTVTTRNGNEYTGLLRWGTEEAFWDDLFNSSKTELPYLKEHGSAEDRRSRIRVFGFTIGYRWDEVSSSRVFISRFGDIEAIRPLSGDEAEVVMKNGEVYRIDGASNDVGATVVVQDESLGDVELEWKKIERITFRQAPKSARPRAYRLYGVLTTRDETFEGWIQWDSQECESLDKLDGDSEDGDLSIAMGKIRSIEKAGSKGSHVELQDGRRILLEGSNDVDESIRGIFVEDERYGRVKVSWDAFERVEFRETGKSGRSYDDYKPAGKLRGSVTDTEGGTFKGTLVFDLDEAEGWEMLNGSRNDVEYYIPFQLIRSVEPQRGDASLVKLKNGTELRLEDGQDVAERNAGVIVLTEPGSTENYVPWSRVRQVAFD